MIVYHQEVLASVPERGWKTKPQMKTLRISHKLEFEIPENTTIDSVSVFVPIANN